MLKMLPQTGGHISAPEQDTQLKIAEKGIVSKIGTRKQGLFIYDSHLSVEFPWLAEQIELSLFDWPIKTFCLRLQVGRKRFERVVC